MRAAAVAYAAGRPVPSPPPSLRLWHLSRANPAALTGFAVLDQDPALFLEWEVYAAEVTAQERREQARASSPRVAGRRR